MCHQHPLFTTSGRGMLPVDTHSCPRTVQAPHADLQSVPWSVTHLQGTSVSTATLTKDSIMEILEELATWTSTGARAQSPRRDQFHSLLRAQPSARCPGVHAEGAQPSSGFKQGYGGHRVLMRCPSPWRYLPCSRGGTLPLALCLCSRVASARPGGLEPSPTVLRYLAVAMVDSTSGNGVEALLEVREVYEARKPSHGQDQQRFMLK